MEPDLPKPASHPSLIRTRALRLVILLGVVSLLGDMTYEGARSITGPYLAVLGASATAVGIVAGLGEFIGYGLRLASGLLSDRTGRYWAMTFLGYGINLGAVPALALAGRWELAAVLIVTERIGKGIRTPPRDAMLSHAAHEVGRGWGFGLHEALDQLGALLGPLVIVAVLSARGAYQTGFALLAVPAVLALAVLGLTWRLNPRPGELEAGPPDLETKALPRAFWRFLMPVSLVAIGYADFALISYHFETAGTVASAWIPVLYAIAMGVDALAALVFGRLFDRVGAAALAAAALLAALFAPLVFLGGFTLALVGMVLWGIGMGAQESIMRANVAELVPRHRRATAYGVYNAVFGLCWFLGSAAMGALYDRSVTLLVAFSVIALLASVPLFLRARRLAG